MQIPNFPNPAKAKRVTPIDETPCASFSALLKKHKISGAEYQRLRSGLGRAPTLAELGVFSAMWSEHCSYKSSRVHLKRLPTEGPNVVVGPGENAGVVRLSHKLCIAFKMESHNHPSYIEPYQGAATGVGGILRDVFCMGSRPIANLNALRFGSRNHPRTQYLVSHVVRGIGDYGNCVGIPTVGGSISFDASYNGNCLVNAMSVGIIHEDKIFKGFAAGRGNLVVYVGSATGRDGIHGATMASDSFVANADSERSTVQVGDPFKEKLLLEATLEVLAKGLVVGLQDMGAAGLTSSAFEMAGRAGNGLLLDLDRVPVRAANMTAYELLLSESQERMLMVVEPIRWPELKEVLDRWQLDNAIIGTVTETGRVQIVYNDFVEVDVPVLPVTDEAPKYDRPQKARTPVSLDGQAFDAQIIKATENIGAEKLLEAMLEATGSKAPIYEQYDHHIGASSVHVSDHQGAAVLRIQSEWADPNEPFLGVALSTSCNESYCRLNPKTGAAHSVLKSARMIAAAGGKALAITDCLNFGNPEQPDVMWEFSEGIDGIALACRELDVPVVSGNVSLYNETDGISIAPTPMIGMVGKVADVRLSPTAIINKPTELYLLSPRDSHPVFGGSLAAQLLGQDLSLGEIPSISWAAERESMAFLERMIAAQAISVCRDVGRGGIVLTAAKMIFSADLGGSLDLSNTAFGREHYIQQYFGELSGAYLLGLNPDNKTVCLEEAARMQYSSIVRIGEVTYSTDFTWGPWRCLAASLSRAFHSAFRSE